MLKNKMFEKENSDVKPLQEVLDKLIEMHGWEDKLEYNKLLGFWAEIVGTLIATHATPQKLLEGVLHIKTDSSVWRSELLIRQEEIIKTINSKLSKNKVVSLKIR